MSCALLFRSHCRLHQVGGWRGGGGYAKPYITASLMSPSFPRLSIERFSYVLEKWFR